MIENPKNYGQYLCLIAYQWDMGLSHYWDILTFAHHVQDGRCWLKGPSNGAQIIKWFPLPGFQEGEDAPNGAKIVIGGINR